MEANRAGSLPHLSNKETKKMEYWPGRDLSHGHWPLAVCRQRGKETETKKRQRQRKNHTLIPVSNSSQNKTADKEAENIEKLDVACLWGSAVLVGNI